MRIIKQLKLKVKCLRRKGINKSLHAGDELLILVFDALNDKLLIEKWLEKVDKLATIVLLKLLHPFQYTKFL